MALPKALRGRMLKNIYRFAKALATKASWRLVTTSSLWTDVVFHKYLALRSILDWIRNLDKNISGVSNIWKAVLQSFDLIGNGLAWKVGSRREVRTGINMWLGSFQRHILH